MLVVRIQQQEVVQSCAFIFPVQYCRLFWVQEGSAMQLFLMCIDMCIMVHLRMSKQLHHTDTHNIGHSFTIVRMGSAMADWSCVPAPRKL